MLGGLTKYSATAHMRTAFLVKSRVMKVQQQRALLDEPVVVNSLKRKNKRQSFDWVFVGELKIIEKHWRFDIQDSTNKFGVSFKNNHRRKINAVV